MRGISDRYRRILKLPDAVFSPISHGEAMVAEVYRVSQQGFPDQILKVCSRAGDFLRESYFLSHFEDKLPVPRIHHLIYPEEGVDGALLMECLPGNLMNKDRMSDGMAAEAGALLARIHLDSAAGYGDLTEAASLSDDPRISFTKKFEEGLRECHDHLPQRLLDICRSHFDNEIERLLTVEGPCVVHRDYRPGNLMVHNGRISGIIDWSSGRGDLPRRISHRWKSESGRKFTGMTSLKDIHR